ncbi:MAG TPA: PLP-dependent cysteine synthase family protein [Sedimentisphaerales bacterium]|nr:PLP-dependent cysteine synthase family protein [Sedimentisphaerales bacterium]
MSITCAIGNTPLVELCNLNSAPPGVRLLAKLEGANPGGSVKDRPAYYMIKKAEESGELTPGKTILEATSGNTGIAIAMIGAARGYRVKLCIPECVSQERQQILQALNAQVVLTPAREGTDGAIRKAHQFLASEPDTYYMPDQFTNEANVLAHYETTGPEILAQTEGRIDVFVAGMGTTGTLMGVKRFLLERKPQARVVGVEPRQGHVIQGLKNMTEAIVPGIYEPDLLDEKITVNDEEAFETTRRLAAREGIFVGMSSGAAMAGALHVARTMTHGTVVALLPDRGDRYLSTTLFRSICAKCPP